MSSANCSRRYYPGASISKQLTDAASARVKQTDRQGSRCSSSSYCPPSPASLHFYGKTKLFTQLPLFPSFLPPPSHSLVAIVHAGIGQRSFIASCAGYKGNLICWQFSVNCRPPFVSLSLPPSSPTCHLLCLPNLICAFLYLWLVDSFSLIGGRFSVANLE